MGDGSQAVQNARASETFEADLKELLRKHPAVCGIMVAWVCGDPMYKAEPAWEFTDLSLAEPVIFPGCFSKLGAGDDNALPAGVAEVAADALFRNLALALFMFGHDQADLVLSEYAQMRFPGQKVRPLPWPIDDGSIQ